MAHRGASVPSDPWTVAIHRGPDAREPMGTGVVIGHDRVLTCAHLLWSGERWREDIWVTFPKAGVGYGERRQAARYTKGWPGNGLDLALLELAAPVPDAVRPARIRCVRPAELSGLDWWTFGFPAGGEAGDDARGRIGPELAYGKVRLDTDPRHRLEQGFSGSGVWSPEYQAVVGLVVAAAPGAPYHGNGHALTLHQAHQDLPELRLGEAARWSLDAAGEAALAAWTDRRFRGRTAALTELAGWLDRPAPDGRVLVVTGSPGAGKSAVLGRLVTTADPARLRTLPTSDTGDAAGTADTGDAGDHAVRAGASAVACAVYAKGKTAQEVAIEIARAASVRLPATPGELVPVLRQRLAERRRAAGGGRFNLVVDALDEAASPAQARQLVREVLVPLAAGGVETGAQVVVGTRRSDEEGDLLGAFDHPVGLIDLDQPEYLCEPDLAGYAASTIRLAGAGRADSPYTDPAAATPLAHRIAALASGNFLVAGLIARAHGQYDTEPVEPGKVSFTPTVDAALDAYLAGLAAAGTTPARLALTVLAYAEPPGLPLPLWQAGVAALGGEATEDELARFARDPAASSLMETNTGPAVRAYRLFHQALGEALLRGREALGRRAEDEQRLLDAWLLPGRGTGWSGAYDYLLRCLPALARRAGRIDDLLTDDRFLLHADLCRLVPAADAATTPVGKARARLLQRSPLAVEAGPGERAGMFSVTERLDRLGSRFTATGGARYHARWARTPPRHERTALTGHADGVLGVCAVPDRGRSLLASAGEDGTVRLWDAATGQPERMLAGHTGQVRRVCAVPAGQRHLLASGSDDGTVRLWNPATGETEQVLAGHSDWIRDVCAVPVGQRHLLASASDDGTARLWDPATGHCERVLDRHPGWVTAVGAVATGGRALLATAGYGSAIRLWDPATGELVRTVDGPAAWTTALCRVRVGGRWLLAAGGYGPAVWLLNPATGRRERVLPVAARSVAGPAAGPVSGLATVPAGGRTLLAVTGEDRSVRLWDPATGRQARTFEGHTGWVRGACGVPMAAGRHLLATAGDDGTVRLWDPGTGRPGRVLDRVGPVVGLGAVPAGDGLAGPAGDRLGAVPAGDRPVLASTGRDGSVRLWDPLTGTAGRRLSGHTAAVTSLCPVTVSGHTLLASASEDRTIWLWRPDTGRPVRRLAGDHPAVTAVCAVPGPDGDRLASASDTVRVWNLATGRIEQVFGHLRWVTALCPLPVAGQDLLASSDEDGVVRLWDLPTGTLEQELRCHHAATTALCAVPVDGRHLLASASADRTILLWDPQTGARVTTLAGHRKPVTGLCVVPAGDQHLLASTSTDRTVRLWDPATGTLRLSIPVHHQALACWYGSQTLVLGLDTGLLALGLRLASG